MFRNLWLLLLVALLPACNGEHKQSAPPPGGGEQKKNEAELAFTTLSKKAATSLKIQTQPPRIDEVQEHLALPGWIMAKPGHEVSVTAPAAGYVRLASKSNQVPAVGQTLAPDQELFRLEPVFSPAEQIQMAALKRSVESELTKAKVSLKVAQSEWQRAKDLVEQKLRGQQELDLAKKALDHASEELDAAKDKQKLFDQPAMPIRTPRAGQVLAVHASPGQYVAAAAPLVTIIDLDPAWLRVPVPESDLPQVLDSAPVLVQAKKAPSHEKPAVSYSFSKAQQFLEAKPVWRAPFVDAGKHSVDFHYVLPQRSKDSPAWAKDQLVTVHLPLSRRQRESVVPYSAIVLDIHGNSWLYLERTSPKPDEHRYLRRRVEVGAGLPDGIVVRPSLSGEDRVVTNGAAALFSREFHFPPNQPAQEVDDDD